MACALCGSCSFPLDSKQIEMFYLLETAEIEVAIVDLSTLYDTVDLTKYQKLKRIFTFGQSDKHNIIGSCPVIALEDCIDFEVGPREQDYQRVHNFEPIANKQQILTLCRTSGSTGYELPMVNLNFLGYS